MSDLTRRIAELHPAKLQLLFQRLQRKNVFSRSDTIPRHLSGGAAPLSSAQQRMWFLEQLAPGNPAYIIDMRRRLSIALDVEALERSLNEIVRRHAVLRTTFVAADGLPHQAVAPVLTLPLPVVNLTALSPTEREDEAQLRAAEQAGLPFDLAAGPLIRAVLIQLDQADYLLLVTLHHIIADGWSVNVFFHELNALYTAFAAGRPSPLRELPIQYTDFARWQQQQLGSATVTGQLSYWTRQLANLPTLALPTDYPRPAIASARGARQILVLRESVRQELVALSQREGVTLFLVLLAGFLVLLQRNAGQEDIAVGVPIAGRIRAEIEELIGCFLNTLVFRIDLTGDPTVGELLQREREVALEAYAHQEVPFEQLLDNLQPQRDLARTPLFQVAFNMLNHGPTSESFSLDEPQLTPVEARSNFDLTLYAVDYTNAILLAMVYRSELFSRARITAMLQDLRALLEALPGRSGRRISALPLAARMEDERYATANRVRVHKSFVEFTAGVEQSIAARFYQQAASHPDQKAVVTRQAVWTYRVLAQRAAGVAQALLAVIGPGDGRAALLFVPGAPMIAAILGALSAGKTYVPINVSDPLQRVTYILRDTNAQVLLAENATVHVAQRLAGPAIRIVNIDDVGEGSPDVAIAPVPSAVPAYILYTSGSTGEPKGVVQSHRNVISHIRAYTNALHIAADDGLTLLSSYCFDAAVMDIFGALLNGAALYVIDIREEGPEAIARTYAQNITIYHSTPTVYRYLVSRIEPEALAHIRLVVLGGEEVTAQDIELYREHFAPGCLLVNGLGPTESTLVLQYFLDQHTKVDRLTVPVGYPVEGTEVILRNADQEPVEDGAVGEIVIKSDRLALGYWQSPELTRAVFAHDPLHSHLRVYYTGDLGRRRLDGAIEFVGRKDAQLKLRGHRVEPGEIESALRASAAVHEAAVAVFEDPQGEQRLVAYVVSTQRALSTAELRRLLRTTLPEYMIPSAFVLLDALPRTASGKLHRRALPPPDWRLPQLQGAYVAPRSELEQAVAAIWAGVLGQQQVSVHHNFFEIGGHSLLAAQVLSRLRAMLHIDLPLRVMFERPTIMELAQAVDEARAAQQLVPPVPIARTPRDSRRWSQPLVSGASTSEE